MNFNKRVLFQLAGLASLAAMLAACSSNVARIDPKYGVVASPRVIEKGKIPVGGGRYQVGKPYKIAGRWYKPKKVSSYEKTGVASWFGDASHGRKTANGEIFNMHALTAAHPTLPLPSYVRVTNLDNKRSVIVRVNDRGPFAHDRLIDLSRRTAVVLDFKKVGVAKVHVSYIGPAPLHGQDEGFLAASAKVKNPTRDMDVAAVETVKAQQPIISAANVAFKQTKNNSTGPLLIWGDEIPPEGSGYVSMYNTPIK